MLGVFIRFYLILFSYCWYYYYHTNSCFSTSQSQFFSGFLSWYSYSHPFSSMSHRLNFRHSTTVEEAKKSNQLLVSHTGILGVFVAPKETLLPISLFKAPKETHSDLTIYQQTCGLVIFFPLYFFFLSFLLFLWAAPMAYGGSQARG